MKMAMVKREDIFKEVKKGEDYYKCNMMPRVKKQQATHFQMDLGILIVLQKKIEHSGKMKKRNYLWRYQEMEEVV